MIESELREARSALSGERPELHPRFPQSTSSLQLIHVTTPHPKTDSGSVNLKGNKFIASCDNIRPLSLRLLSLVFEMLSVRVLHLFLIPEEEAILQPSSGSKI